jgi:transcription initiation factor TFIID subunit 1, fungi type
MQFPINIPITFTRLQSSRKKREDRGKAKKGKDPSEILRSSRDLTMKDTGSYVLYEYSVSAVPVKIAGGVLIPLRV